MYFVSSVLLMRMNLPLMYRKAITEVHACDAGLVAQGMREVRYLAPVARVAPLSCGVAQTRQQRRVDGTVGRLADGRSIVVLRVRARPPRRNAAPNTHPPSISHPTGGPFPPVPACPGLYPLESRRVPVCLCVCAKSRVSVCTGNYALQLRGLEVPAARASARRSRVPCSRVPCSGHTGAQGAGS
jgi:hypothetical protein